MKNGILCRSLVLGFLFACLSIIFQPTQAHPNDSPLGPDFLSIAFQIPDYKITTDANGYSRIHMEGFGDDETPGRYLLPIQQHAVALPPDIIPGSVELVVLSSQAETLPGAYRFALAQEASPDCGGESPTCVVDSSDPVVPIDPAPLVHLAHVGQMRKWQIAHLDFAPFQYDSGSQTLRLTRQVEVQIHYLRDAARLDPMLMQDRVMDTEARELLDNAISAQGWYEAAAAQTAGAAARQRANLPRLPGTSNCQTSTCDFVIITSNDIVGNINLHPYVTNKEDHGHHVWIVTEDDIDLYTGQAPNTRADRIRKFLQDNYIPYGIQYVLLIGDPDPVDILDPNDTEGDVPMKMTYPRAWALKEREWLDAPTDYYYSDLTGNWDLNGDTLYATWPDDLGPYGFDTDAEVYVGRIPSPILRYGGGVWSRNYNELEDILRRLINYANTIWSDVTWHENNVLLPMSFSASGYDGGNLGEEIRARIFNYGYVNPWTMYQHEAYGDCHMASVYGTSEGLYGQDLVLNRWNMNSFGLVVWWGHGNWYETSIGYYDEEEEADCWNGSILNSDSARLLDDAYPSFVFMNSCLNGMPEAKDNLGYTVLRENAASTVSASRVSWFNKDQTGNFENGYTNASFAFRYADHLAYGLKAGLALAWARYPGWPPPNMNLFANGLVFNLYGDPSLAMVHGTWPPIIPIWPGVLTIDTTHAPYYYFSWEYTGGEAYFELTQSTEPGSIGFPIMRFSAETVRGTFHSDSCGKTYYYRIVAYNKYGHSYTDAAPLTYPPCPPSEATNVQASVESNGIQVTWEYYGSSVDGFGITQHNIDTDEWHHVASGLPDDTRSFLDTAVDCETSYEYRVDAYKAGGGSSKSQISPMVTTESCLPGAPTNVHQTGSTETSISLAWTDNSSDERQFHIHRYESPSEKPTQFFGVPANTTSYTDSNPPLTCGTTYYYMLTAYVDRGIESDSLLSPPMTTSDCLPPNAPTNLIATTGNPFDPNHVYLNWDDNSTDEMGFEIERSDNSGSTWYPIGTTFTNQNSYVDFSICSTPPRKYRVYAFNNSKSNPHSEYSNIADAVISTCDPYAPVALAMPDSGSRVTLYWTFTNPPGFTTDYFQVYYASNPYSIVNWSLKADNIPPTTFAYTDSGVPCEQTAYYKVKAVGHYSGGPLEYTSDQVSAIPKPCAPDLYNPSPLGQTYMGIHWGDNSWVETGYLVEQGNPLIPHLWTVIADLPANTTEYRLKNLTCNTYYLFRVRAYYHVLKPTWYSDPFDVISITTLACTASAPGNLAVTGATQTQVSLSWTDTSSNEDGFHIWGRAAGGTDYSLVGTTAANTGTFVDTSAACGHTYDYYVSAYNNSGNSTASNTVTASTIPCTPALQTVIGIGPDYAQVSWEAVSGNVLSYTVQSSNDPLFLRGSTIISRTISASTGPYPIKLNSLKMPVLACGVLYYYRIFATNASGNSPTSDNKSLTNACLPPAPMNLYADQVSSTSATLHWQHPGTDITGFIVFLSSDGSSDWHEIARPGADAKEYTASHLPPGTKMYFKVAAYNDSGRSLYSNTLLVKTNPALYLPLIMNK